MFVPQTKHDLSIMTWNTKTSREQRFHWDIVMFIIKRNNVEF